MKLIVERTAETVKAVKIEYTPVEALVINHAMRRYATDEEVNEKDREIMERMLSVEPTFKEVSAESKTIINNGTMNISL